MFFAFACQNEGNQAAEESTEEVVEETTNEWMSFGDTIDLENISNFTDVEAGIAESGFMTTKLEGNIEEACQKKGCWMKVSVAGMEEPMRVTFKDYGFFVPLDSDGKQVVMEGEIRMDTTDVETLKHFAEDAGKSQEEIDAITEPEINLAFEATGVKIKDNI